MTSYLISYDQHRDRDYTPIWTLMGQWGATRILESVWLVNLNGDAIQVRETIKNTTRGQDSVVVIELKPGSNWAAYEAKPAGVNWLKQQIAA